MFSPATFLSIAQGVFNFCHKLADKAHQAALNEIDRLNLMQDDLKREIQILENAVETHEDIAAKAHALKTKLAEFVNG